MGYGHKTWTRERLTADELQGYLQDQVVAVFESNAQRDAQLPVAPEGTHVYVIETDRTLVRVQGAWEIVSPLPGALVSKTGTTVMNPANAWRPLPFDIPPEDGPVSDGMWDSGNPTRLTAIASGRWGVTATCQNITNMQVRKNSAGTITNPTDVTTQVAAVTGASGCLTASSDNVLLSAGEYLEVFVYHTAGGSQAVGTLGGYRAGFSLTYRGRA